MPLVSVSSGKSETSQHDIDLTGTCGSTKVTQKFAPQPSPCTMLPATLSDIDFLAGAFEAGCPFRWTSGADGMVSTEVRAPGLL